MSSSGHVPDAAEGHWADPSRARELAALAGEPLRSRPWDSRSAALADSITTVLGQRSAVVERCLWAFGRVPHQHLRSFAARGGRVLFGPTIPKALGSAFATKRRGRKLHAAEFLKLNFDYDKRSRTVAIYDGATDLVVFPLDYTTKNPTRPALHEVGHALTMAQASPRAALLEGLPTEIASYIQEAIPDDATPSERLRVSTREALAEGYVYLINGRATQLPDALREELEFILRTTLERGAVRFEFEEDL
jgi:hypothetical protein